MAKKKGKKKGGGGSQPATPSPVKQDSTPTKQEAQSPAKAAPKPAPSFEIQSHFTDNDDGKRFEGKSCVEILKTLQSEDTDAALAVHVVRTLIHCIRQSSHSTITGLHEELNQIKQELCATVTVSFEIRSACELFIHSIRERNLKSFEQIKEELIGRGHALAQLAREHRHRINRLALQFFHDGAVILTHGLSRVVRDLLIYARRQGRRFRVIVTKGEPNNNGIQMARSLINEGIHTELIMDTQMGWVMEKVTLVLIGATAVVESGGVVNQVGTYQMALAAKVHNKPFYIAAESFKFARVYLLKQDDLPPAVSVTFDEKTMEVGAVSQRVEDGVEAHLLGGDGVPPEKRPIKCDLTGFDYTPPQFITLLFTDLGILTPSAVSDELIRLYEESMSGN